MLSAPRSKSGKSPRLPSGWHPSVAPTVGREPDPPLPCPSHRHNSHLSSSHLLLAGQWCTSPIGLESLRTSAVLQKKSSRHQAVPRSAHPNLRRVASTTPTT